MTSAERTELLEHLRHAIAVCGEVGLKRHFFSTGFAALDRVLPDGGVARGSLIEVLAEDDGVGTRSLATAITRVVCPPPAKIVAFDRSHEFYPPAAAGWGVMPERLAVVQTNDKAAELWAAVQSLRSRAVGAIWLSRDRLTSTEFRRLRSAAQEGGTLGMLFRPISMRGQPTWADLQLTVQSRSSQYGRRLSIEVTRSRSSISGRSVEIEWDDVTGREANYHDALRLSVLPQLVDSATPRRATGTASRSARAGPARWATR